MAASRETLGLRVPEHRVVLYWGLRELLRWGGAWLLVHVRRNLLELLLGLSSVIVTTASSYGPLVVVGLDKDRASGVADELERAAEQTPGEAT